MKHKLPMAQTIADWDAHIEKNMHASIPDLKYLIALAGGTMKTMPITLHIDLISQLSTLGAECYTSINDLITIAVENYLLKELPQNVEIKPEEVTRVFESMDRTLQEFTYAQLPPTPEQEAFQAFRLKWFQYYAPLTLEAVETVLLGLSQLENKLMCDQARDLGRLLELSHSQRLIFEDAFMKGYAAAFCTPLPDKK